MRRRIEREGEGRKGGNVINLSLCFDKHNAATIESVEFFFFLF